MKPFYEQKKSNKADWHPADVVAALRKVGWTLRKLSKAHGYAPAVLSGALRRPYLAAEVIIAQAVGVSPAEIWPSRYPRCGHRRSFKREEAVFMLQKRLVV